MSTRKSARIFPHAEERQAEGRSRWAAALSSQRATPLIVCAVLLYGVVYPNLRVVVTSFQVDGVWSIQNYTSALFQSGTLEAMGSSIGLSLATMACCACVGVPLAFLFDRYEFPGRRILSALIALPLVLPPFVGAMAFYFLCGESGILARLVQKAFGLSAAPWSLRGWGAVLLFHVYTMYPLFYTLTGAGLRRIDASLTEAGRSLGAKGWDVLVRILIPQLAPALIAAALMTFMSSMASFSGPLLFGGNLRVLTLEIYSAKQRGDEAQALTLTVALATMSLCALVLFQRFEGGRRFITLALKGAPGKRGEVRRGGARTIAAVCGIAAGAVLVLPVATLLLISFARDGRWTTQILPPEYTLDNYVQIFSRPQNAKVFINSILMSGLAAAAALLWSFCVTPMLIGRRSIWRRLVSLLVLTPWAMPGTVIAIAVAEAYGRPNPLTGSYVLINTFWILPAIYFLRFMPLVVRSVQASMEKMDPALEEAAASLGGSRWRRFLYIRLPLIYPGVATGTLLAFVMGLGEYVASILVFNAYNRPISVAIASEMRDFNLGASTSYGVILVAAVSLGMIITSKLNSAASTKSPDKVKL